MATDPNEQAVLAGLPVELALAAFTIRWFMPRGFLGSRAMRRALSAHVTRSSIYSINFSGLGTAPPYRRSREA